ncbi:hypothetical protein [Longimicrobium sp.]|uniref:hypothetical protein n=1 Tax=Longimicrobium sp. TaxID=2029185 RepID=UPI003B3B6BBB
MKRTRTFAALALATLAAACGDAPTLAGSRSDLSNTTVSSTLSVSIGGRTQVQSYDAGCEWSAVVWGGVAPYAYDWTDSRTTVHTYNSWYFRSFSNNATITLTVTDALGQTATDTHAVTVYSLAPACNT